MERSFQTGAVEATLGDLAARLGGILEGPSGFLVERLTSADTPDPAGLAFAETAKYVDKAKASGVGALLLDEKLDAQGIPAIRVVNPRMAFFMLLNLTNRPMPLAPSIHASAVVDPDVIVEEGVHIGPYAVVEEGTILRRDCRVHAQAYVGPCCELKSGSHVMPQAVLVRNVELGERSVIHPGAVIGLDGFGYVWDGKQQVKIPQVGRVVIGDDVEVKMATIDRATAGATTIGRGTKIDNLVQVAHNCKIGDDCVFAALTGIAGSAIVGDRVTTGGLSGISDHAEIGDDITLAGRAVAVGKVSGPGVYFDYPLKEVGIARRNIVLRGRLHEMNDRIRNLEERLRKLEQSSS